MDNSFATLNMKESESFENEDRSNAVKIHHMHDIESLMES